MDNPCRGGCAIGFWTLDGVDAGVFSIDGGALRFKSPPNYESPSDGDEDTNTEGLQRAGDNIYRVTVRFGAGGQDGTPELDDYVGDDLGELDLTITVTNVEEPGRVYISSLQPQIGTELTATITDQDGVAVPGSWLWASSDSMNGPWEDIPERSTDNTYRPVDEDLNKYLQVTARYRDNVSGADAREESAVSAYPVRKDNVTSNNPPKYPDQVTLGVDATTDADGGTGGDLLYARGTTERFIHENSPAGTRVGAPVTAFDDATDIEVLTYSLSGARVHVDSFNIDPVTGQITVSAAASLNADVEPPTALGGANGPYEVTVIATDGDGDIQTINVDIRVVRVDEPPKITNGPREMSHYEADRTDRSPTRIDTDLDTSVLNYDEDPPVLLTDSEFENAMQDATYTAMDPEDELATLRWSLAGDDGDLFTITGLNDSSDRTDDGGMATLAFASDPDFEDEKDKNKDNVYEVTLVVTDSVGATGEYPVTVKVINSTDDNKPGKVTILNRVPEIATKLTATFEDPDGGVRDLKWQWYRSVVTSDATDATVACPDIDDGHRYFIDTAVDVTGVVGGDSTAVTTPSRIGWQAIPKATSATYTPGYDEDSGGSKEVTDTAGSRRVVWTGGDVDVTIVTTKTTEGQTQPESTAYTWTSFSCLRAAVTYRDAIDRTHREQDDPDTTAVDETLEGAFSGSEYYVKRIDEENDAPVFTEGGTAIGPPARTYTAERREDTAGIATFTSPGTPTLQIIEAWPATDVMTDEDDDDANDANDPASEDADIRNSPGPGPGADILTYSLSGTDAKYFVIVGSVEHPMSYDP